MKIDYSKSCGPLMKRPILSAFEEFIGMEVYGNTKRFDPNGFVFGLMAWLTIGGIFLLIAIGIAISHGAL